MTRRRFWTLSKLEIKVLKIAVIRAASKRNVPQARTARKIVWVDISVVLHFRFDLAIVKLGYRNRSQVLPVAVQGSNYFSIIFKDGSYRYIYAFHLMYVNCLVFFFTTNEFNEIISQKIRLNSKVLTRFRDETVFYCLLKR